MTAPKQDFRYDRWTTAAFLGRLGSVRPAPGGGAAAALVIATALALSEKVERINAARARSRGAGNAGRLARLRASALAAAGSDARAFARLASIGSDRRGSADHRRAALDAARVPLRLCEGAVSGSGTLAGARARTSRWLLSDLVEAACLYEAGFFCAKLNVEANLSAIGPRRARVFAARLRRLEKILSGHLARFRAAR